MTIREAINKLEAIAKEHGDDACVYTSYDVQGECEAFTYDSIVAVIDYEIISVDQFNRIGRPYGVVIG